MKYIMNIKCNGRDVNVVTVYKLGDVKGYLLEADGIIADGVMEMDGVVLRDAGQVYDFLKPKKYGNIINYPGKNGVQCLEVIKPCQLDISFRSIISITISNLQPKAAVAGICDTCVRIGSVGLVPLVSWFLMWNWESPLVIWCPDINFWYYTMELRIIDQEKYKILTAKNKLLSREIYEIPSRYGIQW